MKNVVTGNVPLLIAILSGAVGLIFVLVKLLGRQFQSETQIIRHKVDDLSKDFYSFKEKIAIDKGSDTRLLEEKIHDTEEELHKLQIKVSEGAVTKEEFKEVVKDLKSNLNELKESIVDVDKITREQAQLLARIETSIQSLLN